MRQSTVYPKSAIRHAGTSPRPKAKDIASRETEPASIYHIKARERPQGFRNPDTVRGLVVLQQGGHHPGQRHRAPVERMQQARLAVGSFVTQMQAIGLVGLEIGHRAHFQPAFLRRAEHLEVEGQGRSEADVPPA